MLGSGIAFLDATVVGIAPPATCREVAAGVDALQWVSNRQWDHGHRLALAESGFTL